MGKLIALTQPFFCCLFAKADAYLVTSNADNCPGTWREAITLATANGTTTADPIHFNMADVSIKERTIAIQTSFADVKSDLVIDGNTQPGNKIGVSDARRKLTSAP